MSLSTKLRVVVDTNVFISAIIWKGTPAKVINLWLKDQHCFYISPEILVEIYQILMKFNLPLVMVNQFKDLIEQHSQKIIPEKHFHVVRDEKDNKYLDLCFAANIDYLVTGDKDLLTLKQFKATRIVTP